MPQLGAHKLSWEVLQVATNSVVKDWLPHTGKMNSQRLQDVWLDR